MLSKRVGEERLLLSVFLNYAQGVKTSSGGGCGRRLVSDPRTLDLSVKCASASYQLCDFRQDT